MNQINDQWWRLIPDKAIFLLWEHCNFPDKYENLTLKKDIIFSFQIHHLDNLQTIKLIFRVQTKITVTHRSNESFHCRGTLWHKGINTEPINGMQKFSSRKKSLTGYSCKSYSCLLYSKTVAEKEKGTRRNPKFFGKKYKLCLKFLF
jgi:hypothetical protein